MTDLFGSPRSICPWSQPQRKMPRIAMVSFKTAWAITDRFCEACRLGGSPGIGDEILKFLELLPCLPPKDKIDAHHSGRIVHECAIRADDLLAQPSLGHPVARDQRARTVRITSLSPATRPISGAGATHRPSRQDGRLM